MTWGFAKVILLGEHAVVYDHPAIAGALSLGVCCVVEGRAAGEPTRLVVPAWDVAVSAEDLSEVGRALRALVDALGVGRPGLSLRAEVNVPSSVGLGSSAALAVAVTRAIAEELGLELGDDEVARVANEAERCFHGTPSGIDVALAASGGLGVFRRGVGLRAIACEPVPIVIGLSGQPKRTADMVARVAARLDVSEPVLDRLGALASAGVDALERAELPRFGALMNEAHRGLSELDLSTDVLDEMVEIAGDRGALGAKLTGGGGGGAVIALAPGLEDDVLAGWRTAGWDGFACLVGVTSGNG